MKHRIFMTLLAGAMACGNGSDGPTTTRDGGPKDSGPRDSGPNNGQITVDPASIDFGPVTFGEQVSETFLVKNIGVDTVTIREVGMMAPLDPSFSTSTPRQTIPPDVTVGVTVTFSPADVGVREAVLVVRTNAGDAEVPVRGEGVANPCLVETSSIAFGNVIVDSMKDIEFMVTNPNGVEVIANVADFDNLALCTTTVPPPAKFCLSAFDRMIGDDGDFVLRANETTRLVAHFAPDATTTETGSFALRCFEGETPDATVTMDGVGVDDGFLCTPDSLAFPQLDVGDCLTQTATCTNIANLPIIMAGWSVMDTKGESPHFVAEPTATLTLESDDERSIDVMYCPVAAGAHSADLEIITDTPTGDQRTLPIPLTGTSTQS